jgi:heme-degrading monooxygenase HmoA
MILELATIDIKQGTNIDFENNLEKAHHIISKSKGYISHQFQKCIEQRIVTYCLFAGKLWKIIQKDFGIRII